MDAFFFIVGVIAAAVILARIIRERRRAGRDARAQLLQRGWDEAATGEYSHRFSVGQKVWVRDLSHGKRPNGFCIVEATVHEQHTLIPADIREYPNGEGYSLDGDLWWDCYPGCRVFATRDEAKNALLRARRMGKKPRGNFVSASRLINSSG